MAAESTLTYPKSLGTVLPSSIEFRIYERSSIKDSSVKQIINLYMPEETRMPSSVRWGSAEMGAIGAGINASRQGAGMGSAAWQTLTAGATHAGLAAINNMVGKASDKLLGMNYDAAAAGRAASAATGITLNPYLTAIFNGVDFRSFNFTFKFAPHSLSDCDDIDKIVSAFRKASLPDGHSGDITMKYPDEFEIKYMFDGAENKWLRKFKRSVLTEIDVVYGAGDQWSQHRNGFPTMITLTMKFTEIEIVMRKDVEEGF